MDNPISILLAKKVKVNAQGLRLQFSNELPSMVDGWITVLQQVVI
jgi:hypothetical protein